MDAYLRVIVQPFSNDARSDGRSLTSPLTAPLLPLKRGRTSTRYATSCWRREKVLSITSRSRMWYLKSSEAEYWGSPHQNDSRELDCERGYLPAQRAECST